MKIGNCFCIKSRQRMFWVCKNSWSYYQCTLEVHSDWVEVKNIEAIDLSNVAIVSVFPENHHSCSSRKCFSFRTLCLGCSWTMC